MKPLKRKTKDGRLRWQSRVYDSAKPGFRSAGTYDTRKEAQDAINAFYARPRPRRNETCDSFAQRWTTDYPRPRASTNRLNHERVQKFADDFQGVPLADVDRPSARAWALENRGRLAAVRAMFNDALDDELVIRNPFANLRLPQSRGRKDIRALTESEIHALADRALDVFPGHAGETIRATILFAAYTGVRQGELFVLQWSDLGHDELTVRRSLVRVTGEMGPTKNGRERTIVLPVQAREVLVRVPRRPDQRFVFVNPRDGRHFTASSHGYYWRQVRAAAGFPAMAWHELRHACATYWRSQGCSVEAVAHQLGHTDRGALVMSTYGHPEEQGMRDEIKRAMRGNVTPLRAVEAKEARSA
jgi:integrase